MEEALEQYLILAKDAKGKAQESIALQAVSNPSTYVFGELMPLLTDISEPYRQMMNIFAYGTLTDYEEKKAELPEFKPQMVHKLKLLTLATLAANSRFLPYDLLMNKLGVSSVREVEDLIIQAIYAGLIEGNLDHKLSALHVHTAFGRDVPPEKIGELTTIISNYLGTIDQIDRTLTDQIDTVNDSAEQSKKRKEDFKIQQADAKEAVRVHLEAMMRQEEAMQRGGLMNFLGGFNRGFLIRR